MHTYQPIIRIAAAYLGLKGIAFTALLVFDVLSVPAWMAVGMTATWLLLCVGLLLLSRQPRRATARPKATPEPRQATREAGYVATANLSQN